MEVSLVNLLLVLLAAWLGGGLAQRIGYPAVLGELGAGILLGPALLGVLGDGSIINDWLGAHDVDESLGVLAEMGVLLLMLYIGMEIDPKQLKRSSLGGLLASLGGFITPFALGWAVVWWFRGSLPEGINPHLAGVFVGIACGVTSLATKSRILFDLQILDTRIAHVMMAGALIADTLSLLVFAGLVSYHESAAIDVMGVLAIALRAIAFFGAAVAFGVWGLPRVFALVKRSGIRSRGFYFTVILLVALAYGEAAHLAGLHAVLGTFLAGMFLRETMLEPKLQRELDDLVRDISVGFLAPIYFVMAGFEVGFDVFRTDAALFAAVMSVAFVGKIVGTALWYLPTGHGWREGLVLGAGMNGRGAVEIILAGIALDMGLIDRGLFSILVFMAILTTATVPLFLKWGVDWLKGREMLVRSEAKRTGVVIVGASPTALALARVLGTSQRVTVVDANAERVETARAAGLEAHVGSALDDEVLSEAGAAGAAWGVTMTTNAQVNALAARGLRDVFLVPELGVLVIEPARTGSLDTLRHLEAGQLFGRPLALAEWDHFFARGRVETRRIEVVEPVPDDVRTLLGPDPALVLAVERKADGNTRSQPFTDAAELGVGDVLVVATVVAAPDRPDLDLSR